MSYRIYVVDRVRATRDLLVGEIGSSARHDGRTEYSRKPFRRFIRLVIVIVFSFFVLRSVSIRIGTSVFSLLLLLSIYYTRIFIDDRNPKGYVIKSALRRDTCLVKYGYVVRLVGNRPSRDTGGTMSNEYSISIVYWTYVGFNLNSFTMKEW